MEYTSVFVSRELNKELLQLKLTLSKKNKEEVIWELIKRSAIKERQTNV